MALVVITIADEDDGGVDVKLIAEPAIPNDGERKPTAAHYAGLVAVNAMKEKLGG